jgi:hypothetical protein
MAPDLERDVVDQALELSDLEDVLRDMGVSGRPPS